MCFHTWKPLGLVLLLLTPVRYWYGSSGCDDVSLCFPWVSKTSVSFVSFRNVCPELLGEDGSVKEEWKIVGENKKGIKKQDGPLYFLSLFAYRWLHLSVKNGGDERREFLLSLWLSSGGAKPWGGSMSSSLLPLFQLICAWGKNAPFFPIQNRKELQGNWAHYFFQFALGFPGIFATVHLFKVTLSV